MTINSYLERKDILLNTPFKIDITGKGYFIEGDKQYTREEFHRKYPLPISLVSNNKPNYDGTKSFMYVD